MTEKSLRNSTCTSQTLLYPENDWKAVFHLHQSKTNSTSTLTKNILRNSTCTSPTLILPVKWRKKVYKIPPAPIKLYLPLKMTEKQSSKFHLHQSNTNSTCTLTKNQSPKFHLHHSNVVPPVHWLKNSIQNSTCTSQTLIPLVQWLKNLYGIPPAPVKLYFTLKND